MDIQSFAEIVKNTLNNLYDNAALEATPLLFNYLCPPAGYNGSKGEYIRQVVVEEIDRLKPLRGEENTNLPEWRPYLILHNRYVEGMALPVVAARLAISPRQMRRDHHRALQALTNLLWERFFPPDAQGPENAPPDFNLNVELLDLSETLNGVLDMMKARLEKQGSHVSQDSLDHPVLLLTDRVVLRQILISIFNNALHQQGVPLHIRMKEEDRNTTLEIISPVQPGWELPAGLEEEEEELSALRYWTGQIHTCYEISLEVSDGTQLMTQRLKFPGMEQKVVMVVDDQEPAINLFKRYLSQTDLIVLGVSRPEQVVPLAVQLQPVLIALDVMMPQMDGWEILQKLKLNEETCRIPVMVCSAWADPDLSLSLGASGFLKKPVTRKMFLDALEAQGILSAGAGRNTRL